LRTTSLFNHKGFFYYTQRAFSFFDPLWIYTFGMAFDWNLAFFAHVVLWVVLIIIIFYPAEVLFDNMFSGFIWLFRIDFYYINTFEVEYKAHTCTGCSNCPDPATCLIYNDIDCHIACKQSCKVIDFSGCNPCTVGAQNSCSL